MSFAELLPLVLKYGPSIIPIIQRIVAAIKAGRGNVQITEADWDELIALSTQKGEDIYLRLGIALPPPAAAAGPAGPAAGSAIPVVSAPVTVIAPP